MTKLQTVGRGRPISAPSGDNPVSVLRAKMGWSQKRTAEELGIPSRSTISEYESGKYPIPKTIEKLCTILLKESAEKNGTL